jgi:hypothetical protein
MRACLIYDASLYSRSEIKQAFDLLSDCFPGINFYIDNECKNDFLRFQNLGYDVRDIADTEGKHFENIIIFLPIKSEKISNQSADTYFIYRKNGEFIPIDFRGKVLTKSVNYAHHSNQSLFELFDYLTGEEKSSPPGVIEYFGGYNRRVSNLSGPISPTGFRMQQDFYRCQENRGSKKFTIAFLGGSQLHGDATHFDSIFTSIIQRELTKRLENLDFEVPDLEVLNFGLPGFSQEDELNVFFKHVRYCKPSIVVSHSGWNDLVYGYLHPGSFLNKTSTILSIPRIAKRNKINLPKSALVQNSLLSEIIQVYFKGWSDFKCVCDLFKVKSFLKVFQAIPQDLSHIDELRLTDEERTFLNPLSFAQDTYPLFKNTLMKLGDKNRLKNFSITSNATQHFIDRIHLSYSGHQAVCEEYVLKLLPEVLGCLSGRLLDLDRN